MLERLIVYEDEHLLVVNKPAGWNTHSPSPYAGEGIYEWLKQREPRWSNLAIIHRLDKETSGLMVFGKTALGNRSLSDQFESRSVRKTYVLLTDRPVSFKDLTARSNIARDGAQYASGAEGEAAETRFRVLEKRADGTLLEAQPVTGRTHQIRVHAAENGFPILGDSLYGGAPFGRVCLHARELRIKHPETAHELKFSADPPFGSDLRKSLRTAVVDAQETSAFRMNHGAADGYPGWFVERLGDFILSQSEQPLSDRQLALMKQALDERARGVYHKKLSRHIRGAAIQQTSPELILGEPAPEEFFIRENGLTFSMRFNEGYSVGLFLDQRDNRRRFLINSVGAHFPLFANPAQSEVLNTFSYTCGFSVAAAKGGAKVTSLDLSKKYLEWGRRNFEINQLDASKHDFIFGDTFDWLRRLAKKNRLFDAIVLDPPTFSQSKESGVFRADKDYAGLAGAALRVLKPNGVLFCSTNAAELKPEKFLDMVSAGVLSSRRKIQQQLYVPQPPDFPVTRDEPAYLKTVWLRVG